MWTYGPYSNMNPIQNLRAAFRVAEGKEIPLSKLQKEAKSSKYARIRKTATKLIALRKRGSGSTTNVKLPSKKGADAWKWKKGYL